MASALRKRTYIKGIKIIRAYRYIYMLSKLVAFQQKFYKK